MSELAIELKGIDKSFGLVHANRNINLKVRKGTIHGIIGENGAGKSTLMSILYGFYQADHGDILINGQKVNIRDPNAAIATLEETIKHNPTFFRGYLQLIELYEGQQRWKDAAGAYALAAAVNPRANLTEGRAAALLNSGAPQEAQAILQDAIGKTKGAGEPPATAAE